MGRCHKQRFSNGAEAKPQLCSGNQPPWLPAEQTKREPLQPICLLLGRHKRQSPWGALVLVFLPGELTARPQEATGRQSPLCCRPPWGIWVRGNGSHGSPTQGPRRRKKPCGIPHRGPQSHVSIGGFPDPQAGDMVPEKPKPHPCGQGSWGGFLRAPQRSPSTCSHAWNSCLRAPTRKGR